MLQPAVIWYHEPRNAASELHSFVLEAEWLEFLGSKGGKERSKLERSGR